MFNGINEEKLLQDVSKPNGITSYDLLSQIMPPLTMKVKSALDLFTSGLNCAQAVLTGCSKSLKVKRSFTKYDFVYFV